MVLVVLPVSHVLLVVVLVLLLLLEYARVPQEHFLSLDYSCYFCFRLFRYCLGTSAVRVDW